jgi:hypothetical protein
MSRSGINLFVKLSPVPHHYRPSFGFCHVSPLCEPQLSGCHLPSGSGVITLPPQAGKPAPLQHRCLLGLEAVAQLAAVSKHKGGSDVHAVSRIRQSP